MSSTLTPRVRLDREVVIAAATAIADHEGLDALTIRRLASDLHVTPMALYWHFKDKAAMLDGVIDELWAEVWREVGTLVPSAAGDEWATLERFVTAIVTAFRAHPTLAELAPMRITECPDGLALTEETLELLRRVGLDPQGAAEAARFALCATIMTISDQFGATLPDREAREALAAEKLAHVAALPADRFRRIHESAEYLIHCDEPESFYVNSVAMIMGALRSRVG